jgi:hypothetical protein
VELVVNMVNSYVSEPDCLILLVVTMTSNSFQLLTRIDCLDDIENQVVPRLARHYDIEGQRTLGTYPRFLI